MIRPLEGVFPRRTIAYGEAVKPDGRALDISVVGLGQAGGNLAAEFHRRGYRALALNTAQTDLAALNPGGPFPSLPEDCRLYVGLDGYDGAGSDPSYGQDCLREHAHRIRSAVLKQSASSDVVLICAGLGGGTGSSVAGLIEVLQEEQLPLVALLTLPTAGESGLAKVNAVRAMNDVLDAPLYGWIFADNGRLAELNTDVSIAEYYTYINASIIDPLDALNRLNARQTLTPIRSFDGEDFRKLFLSGGVVNYAVVDLESLEVEHVVEEVTQAIEHSELMPSGFGMQRLSYVGLVIEAPQHALERTSIRQIEVLIQSVKAQTEGAAIYPGIYRAHPDQPITLRIIATTQSMPLGVRTMLDEAREEGQLLGEKVAAELPTLDLGDIADLDLFRRKARPTNRTNRPSRRSPELPQISQSTDGGLDRTLEPRRLPSVEPRPRPGARPIIKNKATEEPEPTAHPRPRRPRRRPLTQDEPIAKSSTEPTSDDVPPHQLSLAEAEGPQLLDSNENDPTAHHSVAPRLNEATPQAEISHNEELEEFDRPPPTQSYEAAGIKMPAADFVAPAEPVFSQDDRAHPPALDDGEPTEHASYLANPPVMVDSSSLAAPSNAFDEVPDIEPAESDLLDGEPIRARLNMSTPQDPLSAHLFGDSILGRSAPPVATDGVATSDLPDPNTYDRLVENYQAPHADVTSRAAIAERLETDAASDITVVRYYAVDAMAKLGRSVFEDALTRASRDGNEAVREIAASALERVI